MYKPALNAAILFCLFGVLIGALGAHALAPPVLSESLHNSLETAVKYQFYHGFALLFTAVLFYAYKDNLIKKAAWCFIIGTLLFSGSIYLAIFLKTSTSYTIGAFGLLTPLGGLVLITGWLLLLIGINRKTQKLLNKQNQ